MAQQTKPTAGYPHIENLIDSEDFNALNKGFAEAYHQLDKIAKEKKGLKTQKEAKKAMKALDNVAELLKELLQVKYRLEQELAKKSKKNKA